jgi:hypothetical protein
LKKATESWWTTGLRDVTRIFLHPKNCLYSVRVFLDWSYKKAKASKFTTYTSTFLEEPSCLGLQEPQATNKL